MKIRGARVRLFFALIIVAAFITACNALLDFESYKVATPDGGPNNTTDSSTSDVTNDVVGNEDGGCIDPTGFGGKGCWRCPATTNDQLLSACTASKYEVFDNAARIKLFDAAAPRPPLEDGGPTPPNFDAGPSSGGATTSDAGCPFDNPTYPNPVLVLGATGFPMEQIAKAMGDNATIYYMETGSCLGVGAAVVNTPLVGGSTPGATQQVVYFDRLQDGKAVSCRIPDGFSMPADLAISGSFPDTCGGTDVGGVTLSANVELPTDWKDFIGAVNPIMYAVPATSNERAISAEAAYRVFGFGSGTGSLAKTVDPWNDETFIFRRTKTSGTQQSIARFLGMPADALRGTNATGSSAMRKAFQQSADPNKTIGINSSEIVDADRTAMKSLAYKHYNQPVAFYPDSDPGLFDRRNVRDGHYNMWIALHVFSRIDANGDPVSAKNATLECTGTPGSNCGGLVSPCAAGSCGKTRAERDQAVKKLAFVISSREEPPVKTVDLFGSLKRLGDVPICAMRVQRPKDGADLAPFTPTTSCACAFEAASPGAPPTDCKPCTQPSDCSGTARPTCSFGFCE